MPYCNSTFWNTEDRSGNPSEIIYLIRYINDRRYTNWDEPVCIFNVTYCVVFKFARHNNRNPFMTRSSFLRLSIDACMLWMTRMLEWWCIWISQVSWIWIFEIAVSGRARSHGEPEAVRKCSKSQFRKFQVPRCVCMPWHGYCNSLLVPVLIYRYCSGTAIATWGSRIPRHIVADLSGSVWCCERVVPILIPRKERGWVDWQWVAMYVCHLNVFHLHWYCGVIVPVPALFRESLFLMPSPSVVLLALSCFFVFLWALFAFLFWFWLCVVLSDLALPLPALLGFC